MNNHWIIVYQYENFNEWLSTSKPCRLVSFCFVAFLSKLSLLLLSTVIGRGTRKWCQFLLKGKEDERAMIQEVTYNRVEHRWSLERSRGDGWFINRRINSLWDEHPIFVCSYFLSNTEDRKNWFTVFRESPGQ